MADLAEKLQVKEDGIRVLNAPDGMALDLPAPAGANEGVLVFVRDRSELDAHAGPALDAARADRVAWIAYPKAGQLGTDLNRDRLWEAIENEGVRPVRQVSIDGTWSAMRFRPAV